MKAGPSRSLQVVLSLAILATSACAHRYSEDRKDWVGPRNANFEADLSACRARMDEEPFRFGGDPRLIFLACMEKRGWYLKGRS